MSFVYVLQEEKERLGFCLIFSLSQSHAQHALLVCCFLVPPVPAEELASICPDQMKSWEWWDSPEQLCVTSAVTKVTLPFKFGPWKRSGKTKWSVMLIKLCQHWTLFVFWQNKSGFAYVNVWVTSLNICLFTFMAWSVPVLKRWVVGLQNKFNLFEKSVVEESISLTVF